MFRVSTAQRVKYNMIKLKKIETIFDEVRGRWTAGKVCSKQRQVGQRKEMLLLLFEGKDFQIKGVKQ